MQATSIQGSEQWVDPDLRPAYERVKALASTNDNVVLDAAELAARRTQHAMLTKRWLDKPAVTEHLITADGGYPPVKVFVINADPLRPRPVVLHIHGGGFFTGTAEQSVADLQTQALALGCVIVTVEYRLAPETQYPGALNDNYAALRWIVRSGSTFGIDASRIALYGDSAGGGHAVMLALEARKRGEVALSLVALCQPMLDDRTGTTRPLPPYHACCLWRGPDNAAGWRALLGREPGGPEVIPGSVPAREADLSGLPPMFIGIGSVDLFVDEVLAFSRRLAHDCVPVELLVVPGAYHGFHMIAPSSSASRRFRLALLNAIARSLGLSELPEPPDPAPWPQQLTKTVDRLANQSTGGSD